MVILVGKETSKVRQWLRLIGLRLKVGPKCALLYRLHLRLYMTWNFTRSVSVPTSFQSNVQFPSLTIMDPVLIEFYQTLSVSKKFKSKKTNFRLTYKFVIASNSNSRFWYQFFSISWCERVFVEVRSVLQGLSLPLGSSVLKPDFDLRFA